MNAGQELFITQGLIDDAITCVFKERVFKIVPPLKKESEEEEEFEASKKRKEKEAQKKLAAAEKKETKEARIQCNVV